MRVVLFVIHERQEHRGGPRPFYLKDAPHLRLVAVLTVQHLQNLTHRLSFGMRAIDHTVDDAAAARAIQALKSRLRAGRTGCDKQESAQNSQFERAWGQAIHGARPPDCSEAHYSGAAAWEV